VQLLEQRVVLLVQVLKTLDRPVGDFEPGLIIEVVDQVLAKHGPGQRDSAHAEEDDKDKCLQDTPVHSPTSDFGLPVADRGFTPGITRDRSSAVHRTIEQDDAATRGRGDSATYLFIGNPTGVSGRFLGPKEMRIADRP
jgi:hypothetical protein